MTDKATPRPCPWCRQPPEVLSGAGYQFYVECVTETCPVEPTTGGDRGKAKATAQWNEGFEAYDALAALNKQLLEAARKATTCASINSDVMALLKAAIDAAERLEKGN